MYYKIPRDAFSSGISHFLFCFFIFPVLLLILWPFYSDHFSEYPWGPAVTQKVTGSEVPLYNFMSGTLLWVSPSILCQSQLWMQVDESVGSARLFLCADTGRNAKCRMTLSSFLIFKRLVLPVGFNILPLCCFLVSTFLFKKLNTEL